MTDDDKGGDSDEEHALLDKIDEAMNLAEDLDDVLIPEAL